MSETRRPRILVTNDDGITARGIQSLAEAMTAFGDVYVVAPDSPQSGMSHAVTFSRILRLTPFEFGRGIKKAYACSGTPVDCVKLAVSEVFGYDNLPCREINFLELASHDLMICFNALHLQARGARICLHKSCQ